MKDKGMFSLTTPDFVKGAFVAVLAAAVTWLLGVFNAPGFDFGLIDWSEFVRVSVAAFLAYIAKNFVSNDKGEIAGKI